ncbi:MAG: glycosyl transferase family 2 [Proteobacteria bacterium]|nr:glycosyl transferase family 2 [Pseudomonadota bacterium]
MKKETLIFIPTYNERENVVAILEKLLALGLHADILFVDDNSPDGTGAILDSIAEINKNVIVHHRPGKLGIGSAHMHGIAWAYEQGYTQLVTMDCDFTHSPEYIHQFIKLGENADVVVGSRYLQEGSLSTWNARRKFLTHFGHWATGFFLGVPYDATGGYRLYRLDRVSRYFLNAVQSRGYSYFFESLFILHLNHYRIAEVPTELPARTYGHSKMRISDAFNSLSHLAHLYLGKLINPERFDIVEPYQPDDTKSAGLIDPQGWNDYWSRNDSKQAHLLYDLIAAFYRRFIIRPSLDKFIFANFSAESILVHAGCGSGQVDRDIAQKMSIMALDISTVALGMYKKSNRNVRKLIHGSIFDIPLDDASVNGIYNLGVMEHFSGSEIVLILNEFHRVLMPRGRIVLFWPPKYGLSVMFLKIVHFILNKVFKKNVQLHPAEITHIASRKQAEAILNNSGFSMKDYSFGIGDLFTHAIIVGEKMEFSRINPEVVA